MFLSSMSNLSAQGLYLTTKKADRKISIGQIEKGQFLYEKVLGKDSLYSNANLGMARLYFNQFGNFETANTYYLKAIKYSKKDTNYYSVFEYANSLRLANKSKESKEWFEKILNQSKLLENDPTLKEDTERLIMYCELQISNNQVQEQNVKVLNIGETINSSNSEYTSVLSRNKDYFFYNGRYKDFTKENKFSDDYFFENIYKSDYQGETKEVYNYNSKKNSHVAIVNNIENSDSVIVYYENKLWISQLKDTNFTSLQAFPKILSGYYQQPSGIFSKDQKLIIFSAKAKFKDDLDLYYSTKNENGEWVQPLSFNKNINSVLDEDAPFLADNDKTLYFSSKGFNSSGDYDIFKSELVNGEWTEAVALKYPINSPANDIYYVVDEDNNAFLSSNREGGFGLMDIYKVKRPLNPVFDCDKFKNPNLTVNFDLNESINDKMGDLEYLWYFDDDTRGEGAKLSKTFKYPGKHEVKIDVIDKSIDLVEKNEILKIINIDSLNYIGYKYDNLYFKDSPGTFDASISYMEGHTFSQYFWKVNDSILNFESSILKYSFNELDTFEVSLQINSIDEYGDFKSFCYSNKIIVVDKNKFFEDGTFIANDSLRGNEINPNGGYLVSDSLSQIISDNNISGVMDSLNIKPIYFKFDKANLNNKSIKELNNIVAQLKGNERLTLIIYGNTDALGSENYNIKLGKRRIDRTIKYILNKGIDKDRIIKAINNGELDPAAPNELDNGNDNPKGRMLNRRVEFIIIKS